MSNTAFTFAYTTDADALDAVATKLVSENVALDQAPQGVLESLSMALAVHFNLVRDNWRDGSAQVIESALALVKTALHTVKERDLWASVGMEVPTAA